MDWNFTLALFGLGAALALGGLWGDRHRLKRPHAALAYLPWTGFVFAGFTLLLFAGIHLFNLWRGA